MVDQSEYVSWVLALFGKTILHTSTTHMPYKRNYRRLIIQAGLSFDEPSASVLDHPQGRIQDFGNGGFRVTVKY